MKKITLLLPVLLLASLPFAFSQKGKLDEKQEKVMAALPKEAFAKPKKARKLLIFSVTNGFRHKSIDIGKVALTALGKETGAYEAVVSDDLANFEADKIKEFDAICFLSTTQEVFLPKNFNKLGEAEKKAAAEKSDRLQKSLMAHIKGGAGFVGIHAATDTFYKWSEYGEMMNGYFWGHPWNAGTPVSIKVEPGQEKHPLVAHLNGENLDFKEEIYQLKEPYDSKKVRMLLRLDTEKSHMEVKGIKRKDNDFGVAWVRDWEKGRVFYCSLGHNEHIYWNDKVLKHYLGGIQWALGDYDVPTE